MFGFCGSIGDAIVERQAIHIGAAAAQRYAADQRRAGLDHAGDLIARITPGRAHHRDTPWLVGEERQARKRPTWAKLRESDAPDGARRERPLCD